MDEMSIRLLCLWLTVMNGSEKGCDDPVAKAQEFYDWVLGITDTAPDTLEVEYGQPYGIPSRGDLVGSGKALMN